MKQLFDPSVLRTATWHLGTNNATNKSQWQAEARDDGRPVLYVPVQDSVLQPQYDGEEWEFLICACISPPRGKLGGVFAVRFFRNIGYIGQRFVAYWEWNPRRHRYQANVSDGVLLLAREYDEVLDDIWEEFFKERPVQICTVLRLISGEAEAVFEQDPQAEVTARRKRREERAAQADEDQTHGLDNVRHLHTGTRG